MIRKITSYEECRAFANDLQRDLCFSDPMLTTEEQVRCNLIKSINQPERHDVLGVYREETLIGLFAFLVLPDEQYCEMLVGLSREQAAYEEVMAYLERCYPGYRADFVFNPDNALMKAQLETRRADFDTPQQKMIFHAPVPAVETSGIELFSEKYAGQYIALHNPDTYWTAEKVIDAPEKFRILLAVEGNRVVGYMDVTHVFEENEPYDLFVAEEYRRRGYGRKLLARALELNHPKGMMVLLEKDNFPAIQLYASMGFERAKGQDTQTAYWRIPESVRK